MKNQNRNGKKTKFEEGELQRAGTHSSMAKGECMRVLVFCARHMSIENIDENWSK